MVMNIYINEKPEKLPNDYMNVEELVKFKKYNPQATAVAVNDNIVRRQNWGITRFKDGDRVTIISAAFGG